MMNDDQMAELFATQKSLTEWLEDIKHKDVAAFRREDNDKRERLKQLHQIIGLPFDRPVQFEAVDMREDHPAFQAYLQEHGAERCALRLIPKRTALPKLRMRGKTVTQAFTWFKEQKLNPADYRADFAPHSAKDNWATIFVVNKHGIQGEIIPGRHYQLTQGFHGAEPPTVFRYDFTSWITYPRNKKAEVHLREVAARLFVPDKAQQRVLRHKLGASFSRDYLEGYFETTDSTAFGTWFIDYSPSLGKMYADAIIQVPSKPSKHSLALVSGHAGSGGKAKGRVRIVQPHQLEDSFEDGAVLVCPVTTPQYVPLMQKASAIVTDQGGILSHAAIVARELGKPCIVGTSNATQVLLPNQLVTVDADRGLVLG